MEEYQHIAKKIMDSSGVSSWEGNLLERDKEIVKQMYATQKYTENEIARALEQASPFFIPNQPAGKALDFVNDVVAKQTQTKTRTPRLESNDQMDKDVNSKQQPVNDADKATTTIKIGDLRSTLNGQIHENNKQLTDLSQQREQVKGASLTKEEAEKLAASYYLNGADKQVDKQAQELQAKRDKLSQDEKDIKAFAKEHGLDTTLWRHAPGFMKGEGLKDYESSMAGIEHNKQVFDKQAAEIQAKRDELQAKVQTPEAKSEIGKKSEEILVQDKERLAKLEALDQKQN